MHKSIESFCKDNVWGDVRELRSLKCKELKHFIIAAQLLISFVSEGDDDNTRKREIPLPSILGMSS